MDLLSHYVRIHLAGAAGGISLFGRGSALADPEAVEVVARIRDELVEERRLLRGIAGALGTSDPLVYSLGAVVGERLGRFKPNGHLWRRTPLTDVLDLEAMRDAVSGKLAGWETLLQSAPEHPGVDVTVLEGLRDQAARQHRDLSALHRAAAARIR